LKNEKKKTPKAFFDDWWCTKSIKNINYAIIKCKEMHICIVKKDTSVKECKEKCQKKMKMDSGLEPKWPK
jgi:hypothetical protein